MIHYGSVGYRSMGHPEPGPLHPSETHRCSECGDDTAVIELEWVKEHLGEDCCEDCLDGKHKDTSTAANHDEPPSIGQSGCADFQENQPTRENRC